MRTTAEAEPRSTTAICRHFKVSRQAFYKGRKMRSRKNVNVAEILKLVRQEREINPRAGTRKLLVAIRPKLEAAGISIGRNRLGDLLRQEGLLVERRKTFRCKTTQQDPSLKPSM